jgi:hypothetical protein
MCNSIKCKDEIENILDLDICFCFLTKISIILPKSKLTENAINLYSSIKLKWKGGSTKSFKINKTQILWELFFWRMMK